MQNDGSYILWSHLTSPYHRDGGKGSGLCMVPKLKFEHIHLSSFAKMRVDLAAQVISPHQSCIVKITQYYVGTEWDREQGIDTNRRL